MDVMDGGEGRNRKGLDEARSDTFVVLLHIYIHWFLICTYIVSVFNLWRSSASFFLLFLYCLHLFFALSRPPVTPSFPHWDKEVLSYLFLLTIFKAKLQKKHTFNVCTILEAKLIKKKILKKY